MSRLPAFYPILDTAVLAARGVAPTAFAAAVLEGGARILQFRHKGEFTREVFRLAEEIGAITRAAGAQYVINDRADIAALFDAGLHVGQDDLPPSRARTVLGPDRLLGFSTHNAGQLRSAADEPIDYLALGPIFSTTAKLRPDPVVGLDNLRAWRSLTGRPLVAIGGLTLENAAAVRLAGADSLAVIGNLTPPGATAADIRARAESWCALLQSARREL